MRATLIFIIIALSIIVVLLAQGYRYSFGLV